jgi:AmmeMemoRadiSam system protein B
MRILGIIFSILLMASVIMASEDQRDFVDPVGFSTTKEQTEKVVEYSRQSAEAIVIEKNFPRSAMLSAICPHDDHIYAGPLYLPIMERISAKHLILIGVFHKARKFQVENLLVFDHFESWKGPYGTLAVDRAFRAAVLEKLPKKDFVVSNEYHTVEHSLEAFAAFIQHFNPEASILPILVPNMDWERMDQVAKELSKAVSAFMKKNNWKWGEDVQVLISNDSVHYGDQGWGGKNYAPFGTGIPGLMRAKERDLKLIEQNLMKEIHPDKLKRLLYSLVDNKDVHQYKITWCGRFSVPFGVDFTYHLSRDLNQSVPRGWFIGYGTSVEMGELPVRDLGLGVTAPANLHHWVAYTSIGYFQP